MKIAKTAASQCQTIVFYLRTETELDVLMTPICGQLLLTRLLARAVATGAKQLIFQLPPQALALQQLLRAQAVNYSLQIQIWWLDPKYSRWQNLQDQRHYLPRYFCYTPFLNLALPLEFQELQHWQAAGVITLRPATTKTKVGWAKLSKNYVQGLSRQPQVGWQALGETLILSQSWLDFSQAELLTENNWLTIFSQFAQEKLVKSCLFTPEPDLPQFEVRPKLLTIRQWFFQHLGEASISAQARLDPSCRLRGDIWLAPEVEIDPFCYLIGPIYLGAGVKVGAFSHLGPDVYLEQTTTLPPYTYLKQIDR
jgi:hypothetical protein